MTLSEAMSQAAEQTEKLLDRLLTAEKGIHHARLYEAMYYSAMAGGKRIRPYLVFEFCRLCGGVGENALWYAAAVEMLHTMSLIHDDLPAMDNDVLRRGKPTNHVVFGEATAVLAGDALLCGVFETAAGNPCCNGAQNLEAVIALARYGGADGMMGGQQIDLQSENIDISREVLDQLVSKKTASLLSCACLLGCIAANAGGAEKEKARVFGYNVGMAFQITDDMLDNEGDCNTLGKSTGKDKKSGKATYSALLGEEKAARLARDYTEKAKKTLDGMGDDASQTRLAQLCDLLLERKS